MDQRRFVQQIKLTGRRISNFDPVERVIGRTRQRVVKTVLVNDLNARKRSIREKTRRFSHSLNVSRAIVEEVRADDVVLADTRQQAVVVEKLRRSAVRIDQIRKKLLFGKFDLKAKNCFLSKSFVSFYF